MDSPQLSGKMVLGTLTTLQPTLPTLYDQVLIISIVTVELREIINPATRGVCPSFPARTLTLKAPDWSVKIGRSTSSGSGPRQAGDNAWYTSRVISRDHAELRADPRTRVGCLRQSHGPLLTLLSNFLSVTLARCTGLMSLAGG